MSKKIVESELRANNPIYKQGFIAGLHEAILLCREEKETLVPQEYRYADSVIQAIAKVLNSTR